MSDKKTFMMYLRDNKNNRIAVVHALHTIVNNKDVISLGWSKANLKHDRFDKEFGKTVAEKRAHKSESWVMGTNPFVQVGKLDESYRDNKNLPAVVKDNMSMVLGKVKRRFKIDKEATVVIPITERLVQLDPSDDIRGVLSGSVRKKPVAKTVYNKFTF